jgi:hypothetical protein
MEYVGFESQYLHYTCHFEGTNGTGHQSSGTKSASIVNPFNKFIKFTLIWTPDKIEWYANDIKYHTYTKKANDYRIWPFDKEFYLILNLAYGGEWAGYAGVDDTKLPHKFLIDYVRVYQLQETVGPFSISVQPTKHGRVEISPVMDLYPENTPVTLTAIPDSGYKFKAWEYQSGANPFALTVNKNTVVKPVFVNPAELLANSEFDKSSNPWTFYVENSQNSAYTALVEDSVFVINITKSPGTDWKLGFQETGFAMEKANYKLKFDAWAQNPNTVAITVSKNYGDWGALISKSASLTTAQKSFEFEINMTKADNNVRLYFGLGRFTGKVYFDNISLTKIDTPTGTAGLRIQNEGFTIFPNPSAGVFKIRLQNFTAGQIYRVEVYSSEGRLLFNSILTQPETELNKAVSGTGLFLVKVKTESSIFTKQLIINK